MFMPWCIDFRGCTCLERCHRSGCNVRPGLALASDVQAGTALEFGFLGRKKVYNRGGHGKVAGGGAGADFQFDPRTMSLISLMEASFLAISLGWGCPFF